MPAIKLKKVTAEYLAEKERTEAEKLKKKNLEDVAAETAAAADSEKEEDDNVEEVEEKNFLKVEILFDKRKRTLPVAELKLTEWLDSNLVKKEDVYLPLLTLYEYYSEVCQMQGHNVVDVPVFNRYIREKFGKTFGFQENSPYNVMMKERKIREKRPPKVKGESAQTKLRDVIAEVINEIGNPRKGLRFKMIGKAIAAKYPALQIDMKIKKLKKALERGVNVGQLEQVRGVGMCGYYRLPGEPTKEEEDEKKSKKKEIKEGEGATVENGDAGGDSTADSGVADSGADDEAKEGETKTDKEGAVDDKGDSEATTAEKKKQKKKKVQKPIKKPQDVWARKNASRHSDPQHVSDALELAITYQSDPKETSGSKIRSYINRFYHKDMGSDKLKKALDAGIEKGLWEQVTGSGIGGKYHLLSETFNPGRSSQVADQISQAIVACSEPKQASYGLIKKYITQYHPALGLEAKPFLLKNALEKACAKDILRQTSGIGANGSFQLVDHFFPSPVILAGDSSDEESDEDDDVVDSSDAETYYVPKPTKRGRMAPKPKKQTSAPVSGKRGRPSTNSAVKGKPGKGRPSKSKSKYVNSESEEEEWSDDDVEYKHKPSKSRGNSPAKGKSASNMKTGTQAAKRGAPTGKAKPATPAKRAKPEPATNKRASKTKAKPNYNDEDSDDEVSAVLLEEYTPRPSKSRGGSGGSGKKAAKPASKVKPPGRKATKRAIIVDEDDEDEDEAPAPKKARGASTKKSKPIVDDIESGSEEEIVIPTKKGKVTTPPAKAKAKKGGKTPTPKSQAKKKRKK